MTILRSNHNKPWTQDEDNELLLRLEHSTLRSIAVGMGRTEGAIRDRRVKLGAKRKIFRKERFRWTPEEVAYLEKWSGLRTLSSVAEHLGKSLVAVQSKSARIGCRPCTLRPAVQQGYSVARLARLFGVSETAIQTRREQLGLDFRREDLNITRGATPAEVIQIAELILNDPDRLWIKKSKLLGIIRIHQP